MIIRMPVVLVCGLPGSGKSTVCANLQVFNFTEIIRIEFDQIERSLREHADKFDPCIWRRARRIVHEKVSELRSNPEILILLDDNFYYKSMRKKFQPNGIIHLTTPLDSCVVRNQGRVHKVPESVLITMNELLEIPNEKIDHCPVITLSDSTGTVHEEFWQRVREHSTESLAVGLNMDTRELSNRENLLNEFESKLRDNVSILFSKIRDLPRTQMRIVSDTKREYMQEAKRIPEDDLTDEVTNELCVLFLQEISGIFRENVA
jgi:tRNA uridine 5-carbamoylmethylation protein Kti12